MKNHSDKLNEIASSFLTESVKTNYSYNFKWLSRPIIQYPQDIVATQEIIWKVKPDLIIETGIAHGGSLVLSASILALLDYADAHDAGALLDPKAPSRKVIGVDIDIRKHNLDALNEHPLRNRMELIEGSSIDPEIIAKVHKLSSNYNRIMVFLDSNHTHDHVLEELKAYAPLVASGSYCVVFDTVIEDLPQNSSNNRSWGVGNNPKTALWKFIESKTDFDIDFSIQDKLLITVAPDGYLKRK
ncbi:cephalosporin hydroxylase family protein [Alphaproteobacteria bacterium]|nr:cephalosporin hydroxylase family protein [Alphaproteobacteria bacterium]MDC1023395.1 cephalosporin hydroxylase family protein [Alphaproteobacteria bacterium]